MKHFYPILSSIFYLALCSCTKYSAIEENNHSLSSLNSRKAADSSATLLFNSGFENASSVIPIGTGSQGEQLTGIDHSVSAPNNWDTFGSTSFPGPTKIYYEGGDSSMRYARIVNDPKRPSNKVLKFWLADSNVIGKSKGRIQMDAYNGSGVKELYQSVRLLLDSNLKQLKFWNVAFTQFTLFELWNNKVWNNAPAAFRISLNIVKPSNISGSNLYLRLTAQKHNASGSYSTVWDTTAFTYQIPFGKWARFEYYIKEGNEQNGRFYLAITPEGVSKATVFDIHNYTHSPDATTTDGITDINPMKLYTNSGVINYLKGKEIPIQVYWDDFELWKNKKP